MTFSPRNRCPREVQCSYHLHITLDAWSDSLDCTTRPPVSHLDFGPTGLSRDYANLTSSEKKRETYTTQLETSRSCPKRVFDVASPAPNLIPLHCMNDLSTV